MALEPPRPGANPSSSTTSGMAVSTYVHTLSSGFLLFQTDLILLPVSGDRRSSKIEILATM